VEAFFFGIHWEGYHLVHHLWPRMPAWNMPLAHKIMLEDQEYKKLHDHPSNITNVLEEIFGNFE